MALRRIDELLEEREKEERGFWIQDIDENSLTENAQETVTVFRSRPLFCRSAQQRSHTEKNQIGRAGVLHNLERARRRSKQRREAKDGSGDVTKGTDANACGGNEPCGAALPHGATEHVKDCRSGNDEQDDRAGDKQHQGRRIGRHP